MLEENLAYYRGENVKIKNNLKQLKIIQSENGMNGDGSTASEMENKNNQQSFNVLQEDYHKFKKYVSEQLKELNNLRSKSRTDTSNFHHSKASSSMNHQLPLSSINVDSAHCSLDTSNMFGSLRYNVNNEERREWSDDMSRDVNRIEDTRVIDIPKIVPGVNSYSRALNEGKKTIVFSTSMTKGIRLNDFNDSYNEGTSQFYKFHGGKVRHIKKYVPIHLEEERPDSVIILAGGNDLPTSKKNPTPVSEIADHIIDMGLMCTRYHVSNIFISSVLPRSAAYMQARRNQLNKILRELCKAHGFTFIENENIVLKEHIWKDGVHLNNQGSDLLARNFLFHLNACT